MEFSGSATNEKVYIAGIKKQNTFQQFNMPTVFRQMFCTGLKRMRIIIFGSVLTMG
jgi:hypothetical protein